LKTLYVIFIAASAVFLVLSPIGLLIGISIHDLQSDVQKRQAELLTIEEKIEEQKQTLQTLADKKEAQEKDIFALRKDLRTQQEVLQAQQVQIDKGNALSQQLWPSLLRDMAASAMTNERMKSLLVSHGYK
jgi:septal ring factor EnvC (AmiA/AmiB activator)